MSDKMVGILQKSIIPIVVVVILAIGGGIAYSYAENKSAEELEKAQDELFVIRKEVEKSMDKLNPLPKPGKDGKPPVKEPVKASEAAQEQELAPQVEKLQAFIKSNQGNQAAVEAAMLVSEITTGYKKYDQGVAALQTALKDFDKKNFLFGVAQAEFGNLLATLDKCTEAAQAWETVAGLKEHGYLAADLRLKAGICYEKAGMFEKAEGMYQAVIDKHPASSAARVAKKFKLYIQFVKAKGTLQDKSQIEEKKG